MGNKINQCNGTLKIEETPDGRDIYICTSCGQESRFNYEMKCNKPLYVSNKGNTKTITKEEATALIESMTGDKYEII